MQKRRTQSSTTRGGRSGGGRSGGGRSTGGRGGREGGSSRDRERGDRGPRVFRKKVCRFCSEKGARIDYKDMELVPKFLTEKGKIIPRRITGNCSKHQRALARAVKRSRHSALIAFQLE